jgi:hypothetical protein
MRTSFWAYVEEKTRASSRRQEKERAQQAELAEAVPVLCVRMKSDLGKIPSGISVAFPHQVAIDLIRYRYAVPVADFNSRPDL